MSRSESDPRNEARHLVRRWLGSGETEALAAIDALGARAIKAAAEASARLDGMSFKRTAEGVLKSLDEFAADLSRPAPTISERLFKRTPRPTAPSTDRINGLIDQLNRELDAIALSAITLKSTGKKVGEAQAALEASKALVEACTVAIVAAEREMVFERPERVGFLRDVVAPRLQERERDLLTQTAITHQAILTLQMLGDSQGALERALVRARDISIAALRTAVMARDSVDGATDVSRRAGKVHQSIDALAGGLEEAGAVGHDLQETARRARREIDAAETSWSSSL